MAASGVVMESYSITQKLYIRTFTLYHTRHIKMHNILIINFLFLFYRATLTTDPTSSFFILHFITLIIYFLSAPTKSYILTDYFLRRLIFFFLVANFNDKNNIKVKINFFFF